MKVWEFVFCLVSSAMMSAGISICIAMAPVKEPPWKIEYRAKTMVYGVGVCAIERDKTVIVWAGRQHGDTGLACEAEDAPTERTDAIESHLPQ